MDAFLFFIFTLFGLDYSNSYTVTHTELMKYESFVAYSCNCSNREIAPVPPQPDDEPPTPSNICKKCDGKGKIKSGDGLFEFPCPSCSKPSSKCTNCKDCTCVDCKCITSQSIQLVKPESSKIVQSEDVQVQVLYFGHSEYCLPCRHMKDVEFAIMAKPVYGWRISKEKNAHIREVVEQDEFTQYSVTTIPTLIRIENGKEVQRFVGALSAKNIGEFYYGRLEINQ